MGIEIWAESGGRYAEILTPEAVELIVQLDRAFHEDWTHLLARRRRRLSRLSKGHETLGFLPRSQEVRRSEWTVAGAAAGLADRRVEITGPPTRRMTVNALNSGAQVWMADFEDALSPTWANLMDGQLALLDAVTGRLDFTENGKRYRVGENPATVVVRPRGWHLEEKHIRVDGRPVPAALVDFALYLVHAGRARPYFYLPKLETHLEARLWNDVFVLAQRQLGMPPGTIRATVLIETIMAAFEMDEILYELREHAAGLNAGRWDYLFSIIRTFSDQVLPERGRLTMTVPFMRAYTELLVQTCHRRGAHAIGGMAAFVPSRDSFANEQAFANVRQDKQREASAGFDGSWVAHPGLVELCRQEFDAVLGAGPHQIDRLRENVAVSKSDLLDFASAGSEVTEEGLRSNIAVTVRYMDAWLEGRGAVTIDGLMEDAATAEISRCQVWQWIRHGLFPRERVQELLLAETEELARREAVRGLFAITALGDRLPAFFTSHAYEQYLSEEPAAAEAA
jgi:malate synthase